MIDLYGLAREYDEECSVTYWRLFKLKRDDNNELIWQELEPSAIEDLTGQCVTTTRHELTIKEAREYYKLGYDADLGSVAYRVFLHSIPYKNEHFKK